MSTVVSEQFNRSGYLIGSTASPTGGTWAAAVTAHNAGSDVAITSNAVNSTEGSGGGILSFTNGSAAGTKEATGSIEFTPGVDGWIAGVVLHQAPGGYPFWVAWASGSVRRISRFDSSSEDINAHIIADVADTSIPAGTRTTHTMSAAVDAAGNWTVSLDGTPVSFGSTPNDASLVTPGKGGFFWRGGTLDNFLLVDAAVAAPTFTTQPLAASVTAPDPANFVAALSGTYSGLRWQRQVAGAGAWADVSGGTGGTTTSYTTGATSISGGSFNNTDKIRLAVDWSGGVVTSNEVLLSVSASGTAPGFSVQPSNQTATVGGTATFNFTVTGSGSLTVQAKKNGVDVGSPVAVTAGSPASYTTPTLLIGDNGASYTFVATGDTAPTATSSAASLTVLQPLATTFVFTLNGGNSLTGLKYAVFDQVTPDLWTAPAKKASNGASNGSGVVTVDVTGLTTRRIGELGSVFITNSDGTATGGSQSATRRGSYYVGAFA